MGRNRIIKICCVVGFVLAEIYMVFVVLGPIKPGLPGRMIIQKEMIPPIEGAVPGAPPPLGTRVMQVGVAAVFFGPFGACVGLGVGLLIEGARRKIVTLQSAFRPRK